MTYAEKTEERTTVRMPLDLHQMATAQADVDDRSLNWVICEAVRCYIQGKRPVVEWPEDSDSAGQSTYRVTLTWEMPAYGRTDELARSFANEIWREVNRYGGRLMSVDGPYAIRLMAAEREEQRQ